MTVKQQSSETLGGTTDETKRPSCPRCGRPMRRDGKTPGGKVRWACGYKTADGSTLHHCYTTTNPLAGYVNKRNGRNALVPGGAKFSRKLQGKRFVVTTAQNATPVNEPFLKALHTYCRENHAELVVIPIRYRNPTSRWSASQQNLEVWAEEVTPYLYNGRKRLCRNLVLLGDIKTLPTAARPLQGFEGITHGESGILGHTKLALTTIATPHGHLPKIMTTTGAVTNRNYTDSKAGKKGEFHHVFGAVVVEVSGAERFHLRHVNAAEDGSFIDLDKHYSPDGTVSPAPPAIALIMGDTHVQFVDPKVVSATFGPKGIVERLQPQHLVWHDLLDGYSMNPHNFQDPFAAIAKHRGGLDDVEAEVNRAIEFLRKHSKGRRAYVVASNHDDFFRRWMVSHDWKTAPVNAQFYLQTALAMADSAKLADYGASYVDPFTYWVKQALDKTDSIHCLAPDESCMLGGIECGFHGHRGPNGARGSVLNLSRIGVKVISGHGHSPGIEGGHYRVGTSTLLKLDYNIGPNSWLNTHGVIYANGKRALINIIDGEPFAP